TIVMLSIATIIGFGAPVIVYHILFDKPLEVKSLFAKPKKILWFFIGIAMWFASIPLVEMFSDNSIDPVLLEMFSDTTPLKVVGIIIGVAILPAVFEEWFFRGILQKELVKIFHNNYISIIVTAAIFSLIHLDMSNFLARFVLGLLLGLLFFYSKSLWVNIFVHFLNNFMAILSILLASKEDLASNTDFFDSSTYAIISAIIFAVFIFLSERYRQKSLIQTEKQNSL
ncbi:MAG: CPBP family intramembrane metalloprotease, partial [Bacteroidota bacterium]|nr:CPBP family intramembrane metalloprotease [Bacteroidota bacterium]